VLKGKSARFYWAILVRSYHSMEKGMKPTACGLNEKISVLRLEIMG